MADVQTQVSGLTNARNTSPGTAYGRINYVLHENVVRANVLDKVKEARQATVESKPDLLGVRGTPWNGSVQPITDNAKYSIKASDWKLTNTLTAEHLNPKDLRTVRGSLHVPNRPSTTLRTEGSGNWNASTTLDPAELKRQAQAMTKLSLANTTQRSGTLSPAKYLTPVQQQTAITEAVRQAKANNGVNYDELVATYGREGADHMVQILTMRATQRQVPPLPGSTTQRPKPRSKTQPADIAAVQALKFADEDSEDERERAAAQQQQQQQEGEEELLEGAGAGDEQAAASAASESAPEPQQAPAPSAPLQASASQKSSSGASAAAAAAAHQEQQQEQQHQGPGSREAPGTAAAESADPPPQAADIHAGPGPLDQGLGPIMEHEPSISSSSHASGGAGLNPEVDGSGAPQGSAARSASNKSGSHGLAAEFDSKDY